MPDIRPGDKVRSQSGQTIRGGGPLRHKLNKRAMRMAATSPSGTKGKASQGVKDRNGKMNVTYDTTMSNTLG